MTVPIGPQTSTFESHSAVPVRLRPIAPVPTVPKASRSARTARTSNACRNCGAKLAVPKARHLRSLPSRSNSKRLPAAAIPGFKAAGPAKIAAMRAAGHDPTTTLEAERRRANTASQQRRAIAAWRDDGALDGMDFRRDILPRLQSLPVRAIAEAMGASLSHGSKVRGGKLVPHKRHWPALRDLV